ncbi:MAG TPA: chemotaxis protein CheW [Candidatus Binatia bacterium]|nr:chemotaxis protein CheW [Candidatus Binatia bacterium]
MAQTAIAEDSQSARVLVFTVDDGSFCIHLDWVEAACRRDEAALHSIKGANGDYRSFLLHRGRPAMVVDLREAFDLSDCLGRVERDALLIVRAGAVLLALQVDACLGVRDLDLRSKTPVPSSLLRDGGVSVGHLVDFDGTLHGLLEPSRILSSALREQVEPVVKEAIAFGERHEKLAVLAEQLKRHPSAAGIKTFGRLSRRNGRTRTAAAARVVLKALQDAEHLDAGDDSIAGSLEAETLLRDLVAAAVMRRSGQFKVELPEESAATVLFDSGRIIDASVGDQWGRVALKRVLAAREGLYRFDTADPAPSHSSFGDATLWVLIEALAEISGERRGRSARSRSDQE